MRIYFVTINPSVSQIGKSTIILLSVSLSCTGKAFVCDNHCQLEIINIVRIYYKREIFDLFILFLVVVTQQKRQKKPRSFCSNQ